LARLSKKGRDSYLLNIGVARGVKEAIAQQYWLCLETKLFI